MCIYVYMWLGSSEVFRLKGVSMSGLPGNYLTNKVSESIYLETTPNVLGITSKLHHRQGFGVKWHRSDPEKTPNPPNDFRGLLKSFGVNKNKLPCAEKRSQWKCWKSLKSIIVCWEKSHCPWNPSRPLVPTCWKWVWKNQNALKVEGGVPFCLKRWLLSQFHGRTFLFETTEVYVCDVLVCIEVDDPSR